MLCRIYLFFVFDKSSITASSSLLMRSIGLIFEEHIDEVGPFLESVLLVVCLDIFVDVFQLDGVLSVCWVVDDDLLAKDMSFESYSQKLEYKLFVHIYVEYRRVVGCLVGDEYR